LWGNTTYRVKLSGEDLSRYSIEIESVGFRKCPYYHLLKKVTSQRQTFFRDARHHVEKTGGIDIA